MARRIEGLSGKKVINIEGTTKAAAAMGRMPMFPTPEGVVAYPSKTIDGEKGRPHVLPLLLYSLVELFLIPVCHAFKKSSRFHFEHRED